MRTLLLCFASLAAITAVQAQERSHVQAQFTLNEPTHALGTALDHDLGYGLGVHWSHGRGDHYTHRTRFDWNVWGQGPVVNGVKTQASNYTLAFDHLYRFENQEHGFYVFGGLGAIRWFMEEGAGNFSHRFHTTKLAVTAGSGYQFNRHMGLEVRYQLSSIRDTFDANTVQTAVLFRF